MIPSHSAQTSKSFQFHFQLGQGLVLDQAEIQVYSISGSSPNLLVSTTVHDEFFELDLNTGEEPYAYIVAKVISCSYQGNELNIGDRNLQLLSVFSTGSTTIGLSEISTIANTWSFARFTSLESNGNISIQAPDREASILHGMKNNFCLDDGTISQVIQSSPNGLETNSFPLLNFLGNLWFYAQTDNSIYEQLLGWAATPVSDQSPQSATSLFQAFLNLVYFPFTKVKEIYNLIASKDQPYQPSLPGLTLPSGRSPIPTQWTLTIKCNDSGSQNFIISGMGYIAFDKYDRAWITNNVRQGTPNSGTFAVVLNPDGSPSDISPVMGGGLLGGGFGITTCPAKEKVYLGNFGWGPTQCNPQTGSISVFEPNGTPISPPQGYTNKVMRAQGMVFDCHGNLWICSWGTQSPLAPSNETIYDFESAPSAIVCYPQGDPKQAVSFPFPNENYGTFDVIADKDANVFVANAGDPSQNIPSSVYKFRLENGGITEICNWVSDFQATDKKTGTTTYGLENFRQITLNANQEVFVTGIKSNRIVKLDNDLNYQKDFTSKLHAPWGITFDSAGTLYASNFSREPEQERTGDSLDLEATIGITLFFEEDDSTAQLMTLPTGGQGVTLRNGFPLYGNAFPPCYQPLMRMTASRIDRVGNLWALNNWKPSAYNDLKDNPGGDGIVIFVGVASPGS